MVLGLRSKHRRGASVKVSYIVHVEEIRPWPPSESLRSIQTVLLQWDNGDENSGSFLSTARGSKIVFDESFRLPVILYQDKKARDKFQKNYFEFSLILPRKDKAKGKVLGTAVINLADYGVIDDVLSINVPVNLKKSSNNSVQPALVLSLAPVDKDSSNSSPNAGLSKQTSLDNDDDDLEIASFSDEDASSQSSRTAGSSTFEVGTSSPSHIEKEEMGEMNSQEVIICSKMQKGYGNAGFEPEQKADRQPSSRDTSSDTGYHENDHISFSKFYERSITSVKKNPETSSLRSSISSISGQDINRKPNTIAASFLVHAKNKTIENTEQSVESKSLPEAIAISVDNSGKTADDSNSANSLYSQATQEKLREEDEQINDPCAGLVNVEKKRELQDAGSDDHIMEETRDILENKLIGNVSEDAAEEQAIMVTEKAPSVPLPISNKARLKHVKSVSNSNEGNRFASDNVPGGSQKKGELGVVIGREEPKDEMSHCKDEWRTRVEMLEKELREAAATEVGLYSVVAEHASSANKVHTPARRLSRFYNNACKAGSQAIRASAARAAVSGLVLVSKSCGHDVPRLTFWLSNSIMLRAIVSQTAVEIPHTSINESDDREDVSTFIVALEKVESWLFSRIVESLWWQTFTPHMQPTVAKGAGVTSGSGTKKTGGRRNSLGNHEQGSFSTELWKKAFKDASERLCPLRAGGHECGCLSVLLRLVMEQLVDRLDIAMFNAILRESADDMPTDPLSDPISDSRVLPIPAGKSSFGAAVELKNTIGNWSRWLTDLFGLEGDSTEHSDICGDGKRLKSFKAFRLLHALSDLMMLPFGMLADASTRKDLCPMFGPTIVKRVLNSFVPDEFCPDPIPQNIIDSLDTEEDADASEDTLTSFPCTASPTEYTPPPAALLTCVGEVGSQVLQSSRLSTLRKSYNSDDELDELNSHFTSIIPGSFQSSALAKLSSIVKEKGGRDVSRYQLLREIWKDDE